jgi:hypothetical protein
MFTKVFGTNTLVAARYTGLQEMLWGRVGGKQLHRCLPDQDSNYDVD